jgi:hypothetical protein
MTLGVQQYPPHQQSMGKQERDRIVNEYFEAKKQLMVNESVCKYKI